MKGAFLVSLLVLAIALTGFVSATDSLTLTGTSVEVDRIQLPNTISIESGETVPVDFYFTAGESASDVQVSTWVQGERSNGIETNFADLIDGKTYHAKLSLKLPSNIDPEEDFELFVRIETDAGNWEHSYTITVQRQPYNADILFVEADSSVRAGSTLPVDVVVKNKGRHDLEDLIVSVAIPELGVSKRAYFADLTPTDECDDNCDKVDAAEGTINLRIPANTATGVYQLEVSAYTADTTSNFKKAVSIVGAEEESNVLVSEKNKEVATGEIGTYDLVIVNSGSKIGVYEIAPETAEGLIVTVDKSLVTVPAGSSETVRVSASGNKEGTYSFAVNVNSGNELVKRVVLSEVIKGKALATTSNITILTVILAIVFVVLLIVLIVLLTRKPKEEGLEESYY